MVVYIHLRGKVGLSVANSNFTERGTVMEAELPIPSMMLSPLLVMYSMDSMDCPALPYVGDLA